MARTPRRESDAAALRWRIASLAVFFVALAATLITLDDPGLSWDEPFSIVAGRSYAAWLGELPRLPFGRQAIDAYWAPNHEHPPLAKLLMGLSQAAMGDQRPVMASRMVAAVLFALLVELVFRFGGRAFGGLAGASAAASLLCMPRVFGHAHFAALDLPMAFTWFLAVAAFAWALEGGGWRRGLLSGLCFGLALLTKINAVFLPLVLVGWGVGFYRGRAARPLAWTLLVGLAVFFIGWPWLWHDTAARLWAYLRPEWRTPIPVMYFGQVYESDTAPWHYPVVMAALTVPVGILFVALLGLVRAVRDFVRQPMLALAVVNVAVVLGAFMTPWMPKYDGVRLFLAAFPFVALLAGVGVQRGWGWVARRAPQRPWRPLFLTVVLFVSQAGAVALIHPYELSYYDGLVGGLWGANRLGLQVSYWHDCVNRYVFDWLNRAAATGDSIAFYPVGEYVVRSEPGLFDFYEELYLRRGLQAVRFEKGVRYDFLVLNARMALIDRSPTARRYWETAVPVFEVRKLGVRLCAVFRRR